MEIVEALKESGLIDFKILKEGIGDYKKALDVMLEEVKSEFEELCGMDIEEVDFENFVEKHLNIGEDMGTLYGFLHHLNSACSSEESREIITYFQPKYVAFATKAGMSREIYERLVAVRDKGGLNNQQDRSLELLIRDMEMAGVHLEEEKKAELEKINLRLAELSEKFSNNVLDSRKKFEFEFDNDESLAEMPAQDLAMAKAEAGRRDKKGWVFTLSPPSMIAVLKYCSDRDVRKKFFDANVQVATEGKDDNRGLVLEILDLRKKKAEVLGFENYAEYVLQARMAESVGDVMEMLESFVGRGRRKGAMEMEELEAFSDQDGIEMWDITYWSRKLKEKKFSIDDREVKKYFELEKVMAGMFEIVGKLYGLSFEKMDVESYHQDVVSYKVVDEDGQILAYFVKDIYARPEKRPGAWCNTFRSPKKLADGSRQVPIVVNVANFGRGEEGQPNLLSHGEVLTLFHEFGHGVHMMLSQNDYLNTGSMSVEWDFVELPSQLMENWCWDSEALGIFAEHVETGEKMPEEMVSSLNATRKFMTGYQMLRQNEFGLLDMKLHTGAIGNLSEGSIDDLVEALDEFCVEHSRQYSLLNVPDYYRMYASFGHIFAGGYAAGYYSYLWAEALEADVFGKFEEEGVLNEKVGREFAERVLKAGASKPGKEMFEDFMGRELDAEALMRKKGL